jgi:predicted Ser/Thr protein kinase
MRREAGRAPGVAAHDKTRMPYCTHCSHALADEHRFCPGCGAGVPALAGVPGTALKEDATRTSAKLAVVTPPLSSGSSSGLHGRFESGTRIGNRYRVVALLGRGGMGEVYRADDLELGQPVALKFLPHAVAHDATDLARFRSEVRLARQIAHTNVCRVYDIGEADGHVFLSMEYIDGEDLASVLRRMGRPSPDKAIEIARQICLGLAAAHDGGMLHRDMKPANIMIDGRGRVRITDFGLAGLTEDLAEGTEVAGTPAYMAPEQLAHGRASVKSDIYALGLVLYEVFTGKRVFATNDLAELRRLHESGPKTTPSQLVRDLDPAVERIILQCLQEDPDIRPPSAYAVLGALPGGDPLAAALAAGETPSPELVANAGDKGTTSPVTAVACVLVGLAAMAAWAAIIGPDFAALPQPTEVLTVRASDILGSTGAFAALPGHTAEGFAINDTYLEHLRSDRAERLQGAKPFFFWRRWSPALLEAPNVHAEVVFLNSPPLASGRRRCCWIPTDG